MRHLENEQITKLRIYLNRIYIEARILWRNIIGACWACGTRNKEHEGEGFVCNYCNKRIKIKS